MPVHNLTSMVAITTCAVLTTLIRGRMVGEAAPARDVAGITLGMPLAEAAKRLEAYGTLPGWRVDQFKHQIPALGQTFVVALKARNHRQGDDVGTESIEIEFAPSPPPAEPVVTKMMRSLNYLAGKERELGVVLDALKERFGTVVYNAMPAGLPGAILWWYYDGAGRPVTRNEVCLPAASVNFQEGWWRGVQFVDLTKVTEMGSACGVYANVNIGALGDRQLVQTVSMVVSDARTRAARYQAMAAHENGAAAAARQKAVDDAAKRKPPTQ